MTSLSSPVPTVNQSSVPYSQIHNLYCDLILRASRRHALVALMPALDAAMRPAENGTKLARLNAIAATLESEK